MPRGRPCKLTPELQKRLCDAIAAGNFLEAACGYAGIDYTTFWRWMERGKKARRGKFCDFCQAVRKAEADAEVRVVAQWQAHMPQNHQACRDFLARRFPQRWCERHKIEQQTQAEHQHNGSLETQEKLNLEEELKPYADVLRGAYRGLAERGIRPDGAPQSVDSAQADTQAGHVSGP